MSELFQIKGTLSDGAAAVWTIRDFPASSEIDAAGVVTAFPVNSSVGTGVLATTDSLNRAITITFPYSVNIGTSAALTQKALSQMLVYKTYILSLVVDNENPTIADRKNSLLSYYYYCETMMSVETEALFNDHISFFSAHRDTLFNEKTFFQGLEALSKNQRKKVYAMYDVFENLSDTKKTHIDPFELAEAYNNPPNILEFIEKYNQSV